jgi:hypothetical protein
MVHSLIGLDPQKGTHAPDPPDPGNFGFWIG